MGEKLDWKAIKQKYPDLEDYLDKMNTALLAYYDMFEVLDKKYAVEGYTWDCDPNVIGVMNPYYLESNARNEEIEKSCDERLEKQLVCVSGEHHFIQVKGLPEGVKWCKYCGTLIKENEDGTVEKYEPEQPHFLSEKGYSKK